MSKLTSEQKHTQDSQEANLEQVNNPEYLQHPATSEVPGHLAAKMHAPYPEKPAVQHLHESLVDETPSGYVAHDPAIDLDQKQLDSQKPSDTDSYREAKHRVEEDKKNPSSKAGK